MKKLFLQAARFVGLSGVGWILDFCTYTVLGIWFANVFMNNFFSSWVGVTFVFLTSTRFVFKNASRIPLKWKYLIYLLYQCILIVLISKLLDSVNVFLLENIVWEFVQHFSAAISKIVVTPITMVLNFFVMKYVIEKI